MACWYTLLVAARQLVTLWGLAVCVFRANGYKKRRAPRPRQAVQRLEVTISTEALGHVQDTGFSARALACWYTLLVAARQLVVLWDLAACVFQANRYKKRRARRPRQAVQRLETAIGTIALRCAQNKGAKRRDANNVNGVWRASFCARVRPSIRTDKSPPSEAHSTHVGVLPIARFAPQPILQRVQPVTRRQINRAQAPPSAH